ncbi:MAG: LPS export ABC transporter periplasmic protein LptC, partial [Segetibacter sp.]
MSNRQNKLFKNIAAIITGCFFVWSCENDIREVQDLNKKAISVEEGKQIESYLSENGKIKAKLTAPLMLRYQKDTPKVEFPKSLHVDFYNDSTKVESQLSAKYGRYMENENKVFL